VIALLKGTGEIAIWLDSLHLYRTYEDWLIGGPKASEMESLMRRWAGRAQALYQDWPVHSVQPVPRDEEGFLPDHVCIGFFYSPESREPDMDGSALVMVWYQQTCPVDGINLPVISDASWRASAKDFQY
jgi:hypothetical protein